MRMAWLRRLFGSEKRDRPDVDVARLIAIFERAAGHVDRVGVDSELIRARLADAYRDENIVPPSPESFDELTRGLDAEAWQRLAVLVAALDVPDVRALLSQLLPPGGAIQQLEDGFVRVSIEKSLLSLPLLRQSSVRLEELARELAAGLGARIGGETAEESETRRSQLDYARLLEQADKNREAAAEHAAYLRELNPDEPTRRSKW
ncbi:MAG: hypothetical protein HY791_09840 [Deltaproteobacteria bacterium]|nr:hypothetical protein [Deltaproteobacteria bacterium]